MATSGSTGASEIQFSVDLASAVINELDFLERVNEHPSLYGGPVVKRAIERYERLWLPLAAEHPGVALTAPLDVEWVWHCHLLAPVAYDKDCWKLFGCVVVGHRLSGKDEYENNLKISQKYWEAKYSDEPFFVNLNDVSIPNTGFQSSLSYNLEEAVSRQKVFYYQVSLPHYRDKRFRNDCVKRYKKFLYLKRQTPDLFIVPCYDIDALWHTHLVHPVEYRCDTEKILGKIFNHDDSINDRNPGSKLSKADAEIRIIWRESFNDDFSCFGGMFRGEPPNGQLYPAPKSQTFQLFSKTAQFSIHEIKLKCNRLTPDVISNLKVIVICTSGMDIEMLKLKKPSTEGIWNKDNCKELFYDLDTSYCEFVEIHITKRSGFLKKLKGNGPAVIEGQFHIETVLQNCKSTREIYMQTTDLKMSDGSVVELTQGIKVDQLGSCVLKLIPGQFEESVMPEDIEQLWGPIPLQPLPEGQENLCSVASHKITSKKGDWIFTCRVIHSIPLLTSAVQIFYKDKLCVVSHLIGLEQLPLYTQITDKERCVTINPGVGERAFLIKNNSGDWAVVKGRWTGMRKGSPGTRSSNGSLEVKVFKFQTKRWQTYPIKRKSSEDGFIIKIGETEANFTNGCIRCDSTNLEVEEQLALVFSVAVLHVICQPRPRDWQPGKPLVTPRARCAGNAVSSFETENLKLLVAMGLLILTPSNHFFRHKFGKRRTIHPYVGVYDHDEADSTTEAMFARSESIDPTSDLEDIVEHDEDINFNWADPEHDLEYEVDLDGTFDDNGDVSWGCGGFESGVDGDGETSWGNFGGQSDAADGAGDGGGGFFGGGCDSGGVGDSGGGAFGGDCGGDGGGGGCGGCGGCGG